MRLLAHNMLVCNVKNCNEKNYPFRIRADHVETVTTPFNREFITNVLNKIEWEGVVSAASDLNIKVPEKLPEDAADDEEFLKNLYNFLQNIHVIEGALICPKCAREFPITQGIPNMIPNIFVAPKKARVVDPSFYRLNESIGEIFELRQDLSSNKDSKKKEAIKTIIASMTFGKDASLLFIDVLNCIQTNNLELKKLVYLYLINYAKNNSERSILAVNTFTNDANDPNPLIRALAIRTMGCIWVENVAGYLYDILTNALKDGDFYVLKTAVLCVAKLYKMNPKLAEGGCFIKELNALLFFNNSTLVANAISTLVEIHEIYLDKPFLISKPVVFKLLNSLEYSTAWAQITIINVLVNYTPDDSAEAVSICAQLVSRLQYSNCGIILATVRTILYYIDFIDNEEVTLGMCRRIVNSLLTLLLNQPEIQYIVLRNLNIIIQRYPTIFMGNIKPFFCKFNDPTYLKVEKLNVMVLLVDANNISHALLEMKEYIYEVDAVFSRRAVSAIGECAIKLESFTDNCLQVLVDVLRTKTSHVIQEFFIVARRILCKYPKSCEKYLPVFFKYMQYIQEPESKVAMIWIIGEFAEFIDDPINHLQYFINTFASESLQVQKQILISTIRLYFKLEEEQIRQPLQNILHAILKLGEAVDDPDFHDRLCIYKRLLECKTDNVKNIILTKSPQILHGPNFLDRGILDQLLCDVSYLSSVYHKLPHTFIAAARPIYHGPRTPKKDISIQELPQPQQFPRSAAPSTSLPIEKFPVFDSNSIRIQAGFNQTTRNVVALHIEIINNGKNPITGPFLVQVEPNFYGLQLNKSLNYREISVGKSISENLDCSMGVGNNELNTYINVTLKCSFGVHNFKVPVHIYTFFAKNAQIDPARFLDIWNSIPTEEYLDVKKIFSLDLRSINNKLECYRVYLIASRDTKTEYYTVFYMVAKMLDSSTALIEIAFVKSGCKLCVKSTRPQINTLLLNSLGELIST